MGIALHAISSSLNAIHHNLEPYPAEKFFDGLRMYFSATTEPFLTIFEFRSVLYACCALWNKEHIFEVYCQEFDNLMPESPAYTEPRKLTDLTRCQVRENMKMSNVPLPAAVDKLPLPKILKSFVTGDVTDLSRKRVNAQNVVTKSELEAMFHRRPMV